MTDQQIHVRLRGGDSARKALTFKGLSIDGLVRPFSDEVHFGERVALVGPNGSGKTHVLRLAAGEAVTHDGTVVVGNRVAPGLFSQLNARPDFTGRPVLDIVMERTGAVESAMRGLARYGLQEAARRRHDQLSGGQKAPLEILVHALPDAETTLAALQDPAAVGGLRLAKPLS